MKRVAMTLLVAVVLLAVLAAGVLAQGGAVVVQPQSFRIKQDVPLKLAVSVPSGSGQMVNTTLPLTVGLTIDVVISGGGAVSVQAAPAAATAPAGVQTDAAGRRYLLESTAQIRIDQAQSKADSLGEIDIDGVVTNVSGQQAKSVLLAVTLYDAQGRVLDTTSAVPTVSPLGVGQSSPFSIISRTPAASVASYRIQVAQYR